MRAVAIIICLMLVAGCGGPDAGEPTAESAAQPTAESEAVPTAAVEPTSTAAADACETATQAAPSRQVASIAPVEGGATTPATSWVRFEDLYELAWASHLIVRGRVTEDCGTDADDGGVQTMPDFDKRMLVSIDAVYRGRPIDSILVPATSDGFSSDAAMTFAIGDEVILFMSADGFLVGGPQGHWHVIDGRAVPNTGHFPTLPLDTFARSLASALHQDPPASLHDRFPSLDVAPPGPALPVDREAPAACDGVVPPPGEFVEAVNDLVWVSERIVIGTVSDILPAVYVDDPIIDVERSLRVPVTDYVIQIEQHLRGTPTETITLRRLGGTVDGCTVDVHGAPDLNVGDRLLLFLTPLADGQPTYVTSGGQRGLWRISDDGAFATATPWQFSPQFVPTADIAALVARALAGDMPTDQWITHDPVALEHAPLGDIEWPEPYQPDGWSAFDDPAGQIAFDYPNDWTLLPIADDGAIVLASWPASAATEPVPAGAILIEIRQHSGSRWFDDPSSVPVRAGDQWATVYVQAAPPHDIQLVIVSYLRDGAVWEFRVTYGAPPSPDDPATRSFYTLLRSIRHPAS